MSDVKTPQKKTRREQAQETRERIVRAALEVFVEEGYAGTRMADIAKRAGVAVQTVYFVFHTKPELLSACFEFAVLGPEKVPPPLQSFNEDIRRARSGRAMLKAFVTGNAAICARAAAINEVARGASHEPEPKAVLDRSEDLRREGLHSYVVAIDERFGLRDGLRRDRATDILMTVNHPQTYLTLRGYGWSDEEFIAWATDTCAAQLLAKPGRR
ncbi:MAG: TetR/AcrR family transcriptional regulator [Marmoricola sp.]